MSWLAPTEAAATTKPNERGSPVTVEATVTTAPGVCAERAEVEGVSPVIEIWSWVLHVEDVRHELTMLTLVTIAWRTAGGVVVMSIVFVPAITVTETVEETPGRITVV